MFDTLIRGGWIVDGSGNAPFRGDLALRDGMIAAMGNLHGAPAKTVLDAAGRTVVPGFIAVNQTPDAALLLRGVTTVLCEEAGTLLPVNVGRIADWDAPEVDLTRLLSRFCAGTISVQTLVRRAAVQAELPGKGRLLPGFAADVAVFELSGGRFCVDAVFVNGQAAVLGGVPTGVQAGKLLTK